jgi:hypothetical protein
MDPVQEGVYDSFRVLRNSIASSSGIASNLLLCDEMLKARQMVSSAPSFISWLRCRCSRPKLWPHQSFSHIGSSLGLQHQSAKCITASVMTNFFYRDVNRVLVELKSRRCENVIVLSSQQRQGRTGSRERHCSGSDHRISSRSTAKNPPGAQMRAKNEWTWHVSQAKTT